MSFGCCWRSKRRKQLVGFLVHRMGLFRVRVAGDKNVVRNAVRRLRLHPCLRSTGWTLLGRGEDDHTDNTQQGGCNEDADAQSFQPIHLANLKSKKKQMS